MTTAPCGKRAALTGVHQHRGAIALRKAGAGQQGGMPGVEGGGVDRPGRQQRVGDRHSVLDQQERYAGGDRANTAAPSGSSATK